MIQEQMATMLELANTSAANRIYPMVALDSPTRPYITYQVVSGTDENVLSGSSGLINTRMQINCWADSYAAAHTLASQVKTAMAAWSVQNVSLSSQDVYEQDTKLHGVQADYSIWHQ